MTDPVDPELRESINRALERAGRPKRWPRRPWTDRLGIRGGISVVVPIHVNPTVLPAWRL